MASDFSKAILKPRRQWSNAVIILKENDFQLKILYLANYGSNVKGEKKNNFQACKALKIFYFSSCLHQKLPKDSASETKEDSGDKNFISDR